MSEPTKKLDAYTLGWLARQMRAEAACWTGASGFAITKREQLHSWATKCERLARRERKRRGE